ncbi:conserved hypothetical protein [Thermotomaculum hydrothermale]|uniref:DUF47 domain-containing protein n=1 Tax=Thermotomaculum hydrothermale TaxID=981385 RepID=A0A7R6PZT7_9BACT|nr:DUF47 family protein [Thermotomaculum hydrothermale]BBB32848.1 conserved hypothetical protein [Thermotomaculum hydrothermale]
MKTLFNSKKLENQIDQFLDAVSQGLIVFLNGVKSYFGEDKEDFAHYLTEISKLESEADKLRRQVENDLYTFSLIPENRGDVLALLEHLDNVIDTAKETLHQFDVEVPDIPLEFADKFIKLAETSCNAGEEIVLAARAFFKDIKSVRDHVHKVYFYEKEADRLSNHLKKDIFRTDMKLSRKIHLRDFTTHVEKISDDAEDVADRLSIYTIKRMI